MADRMDQAATRARTGPPSEWSAGRSPKPKRWRTIARSGRSGFAWPRGWRYHGQCRKQWSEM